MEARTRQCASTAGAVHAACWYLLLLGVELEALGQRAGLRLMVLLAVQVNALGVGDVLLLRVSEQTAGGDRGARGRFIAQRRHNVISSGEMIRLDTNWLVSLKSIPRT